jgi:hypothetical protein
MRVPPPTANVDGLHVSLAEIECKADTQGLRHDGTSPRDLEDCVEFQPQRFVMLRLPPSTYGPVIWDTSQFGGHALNWWLNAKTNGQFPRIFA